ncbi:MAG: hypothetical protein O3C45_08940 [Bacteroidetes bacterium]|nr:hypothetical protein [Bacteroidota bacterium]
MNPAILELIQTEIDGQNTPSESSRLADLCRQDPAIQRELDAARAIGRALDTLSDARLPDGFTARVMDALPDEPAWARHRAPSRAPSRAPIRSSVGIFSRPWVNLAYGVVVGVFVTFAAMSTLDSESSLTGVSGSMGAAGGDPVISETVTLSPDATIGVQAVIEGEVLTVRINGILPDGTLPSIVFEQADGSIVTVPIHLP